MVGHGVGGLEVFGSVVQRDIQLDFGVSLGLGSFIRDWVGRVSIG